MVFRDIVERHKISNTTLIQYLIRTLIKNAATPFSVHKFYRDLKSQGIRVGKDTLYQYLDYIEDAFLVFGVSFFSESLRKTQVNPKKIYTVDNGFIHSHRFNIQDSMGSLFENQVYLDLKRQGKQIWYYLTQEGYEIDFVTKSLDGSLELLQATWDVQDPKTMERETRALEQAEKELGIKGRLITPQNLLLESLKT